MRKREQEAEPSRKRTNYNETFGEASERIVVCALEQFSHGVDRK
jgi:hypothetical protein